MDALTARRYLAYLRLGFGVTWLTPRFGARLFGLDPSLDGVVVLTRLFAVRDVAIGAAALQSHGENADRLADLQILIDSADLAALVLAASRKQISTRTLVLGGGAAAGAVALGLLGRRT